MSQDALKLETLYVYCNDAFEPSADEFLADLQNLGTFPMLS